MHMIHIYTYYLRNRRWHEEQTADILHNNVNEEIKIESQNVQNASGCEDKGGGE